MGLTPFWRNTLSDDRESPARHLNPPGQLRLVGSRCGRPDSDGCPASLRLWRRSRGGSTCVSSPPAGPIVHAEELWSLAARVLPWDAVATGSHVRHKHLLVEDPAGVRSLHDRARTAAAVPARGVCSAHRSAVRHAAGNRRRGAGREGRASRGCRCLRLGLPRSSPTSCAKACFSPRALSSAQIPPRQPQVESSATQVVAPRVRCSPWIGFPAPSRRSEVQEL